MPSARDVEALIERIDALNAQVQRLGGKAPAKAAARKASTPKKVAPAKKAAARKTTRRTKAA